MAGQDIAARKLQEALERLAGFRKSTDGKALTLADLAQINELLAQSQKSVTAAERRLSALQRELDQAFEAIRAISFPDTSAFASSVHGHEISDITGLTEALAAAAQYGENSNGAFLKCETGALICWKKAVISSSLAAGAFVDAAWTFPHAFDVGSVPAPVASVRSLDGFSGREAAARHLRPSSAPDSATSGYVGAVNLHSSALDVRVDAYVFGRWR